MPLQVTPEMQRLIDKPGYLRAMSGGQRLRELFSDNSLGFHPLDLSPFGLVCYLGAVEEVKKQVQSGEAPDLSGTETAYKSGYLTLVVLGNQRVQAPPHIGKEDQTMEWVATVKFLLQAGCPTEVPDIVGYTALMHSSINKPVPELTRVLAEGGADVNHRNKFGAVALVEACMQSSVDCIGILLEHGASMDIGDADGVKASGFFKLCGPAVVAEVSKWLRKRSGEEGLLQAKSCDFCGKSSKEPNVKLAFCSRCRLRRYCSAVCQKSDWKSHKRSCKPFAAEATAVTLKPTYFAPDETTYNPAELTRAIVNMLNPGSIPTLEPKPRKDMSTIPMDVSAGRQFIIKAQLPVSESAPPRMMIYNHKRDFRCHIERESNVAEYDRLKDVITQKGMLGLKAYFMAELKNKHELLVQTEVVSEQAW